MLIAVSIAYPAWHGVNGLLVSPETRALAWVVFGISFVTLLPAYSLWHRHYKLGATWLIAWAIVVNVSTMLVLQSWVPLLVLPLFTLLAVVLLSLASAGVAVIVSCALLLWVSSLGALPFLDIQLAAHATAAMVVGSIVGWVLDRSILLSVSWAFFSYEDARRHAEDARQHRAELVQAMKQLDNAYHRLEQFNLELEQARRAAQDARRLKEEFAAAVSHELRTPLNLILGFCEMMVLSPDQSYGEPPPPSYREDLEAIYRNTFHLSALVDDILDLSRIDANRMALHRQWVNLSEVVAEAVRPVESLYRNRDLTLASAVPPDALPAVWVDRTRIRQILINLLSNAARFVQRGGVTITAETRGSSVVLGIADTGPGIAPQDLPHVFDEFRQVGSAGMLAVGSGLGLAVSKRFAELHAGTMWAESTLGIGSTFYLALPLTPERLNLPVADGLRNDRLSSLVRGQLVRRVLVVDDETSPVHKIVDRYLDGYEVCALSDVESSADDRVGGLPCHAVVLGSPAAWQAWQALKVRVPDLAHLPTISCYTQTSQYKVEGLESAVRLAKPVTRDQLLGVLRQRGKPPRSAVVVDDEPAMTRLLSRMLRSIARGCSVHTATDGAAAMGLIQKLRPDVVLLDIAMPGVDGWTVLETIRRSARLANTYVIVVSGLTTDEDKVKVTTLSVTREDGLSVGVAMRWLKAGLDAALPRGRIAPASGAEPPGSLV